MGLKDIVKKGAFVDILRGMSVTGEYFVVDKVTVEYPVEKLRPFPRFRGAHALLSDPATGDTKCVACMLCPTICPSGCIHVVGEQTPDGRSHPATFEIELSRCIFCGLCEEVCPVAAIVMTNRYELCSYDKRDFLLDKEWLMANAVNAHKEVFVKEGPEQAGPSTRPASAAESAGAAQMMAPARAQGTAGENRPPSGPSWLSGTPGAPGPGVGRAVAPAAPGAAAQGLAASMAASFTTAAQAPVPGAQGVEEAPRPQQAGWRKPGAPKAGFELLTADTPERFVDKALAFGGAQPGASPNGAPASPEQAAADADDAAPKKCGPFGRKGGRR